MSAQAPMASIAAMVAEALVILGALGVPLDGLTERRRQRMAKVFMAVAGLTPAMAWQQARDSNDLVPLATRQIIGVVNAHWAEKISSGSYDDIRRKDLVLPVAAMIIFKSAKNPDANTNDGTRGFALNPLAANAIRAFDTPRWPQAVAAFHQERPSLAATLARARNLAKVTVTINGVQDLSFSPGAHNVLQREVIEKFLLVFGSGADVLYVGDTADKSLFLNSEGLRALHFFELGHDKLPDVVAYSASKNWLFLIEAVTTANPISELRRLALLNAARDCSADLVFVTAFPNRKTYQRFAHDIAWETEVWIADAPEHMIHFNGSKFLGAYK